VDTRTKIVSAEAAAALARQFRDAGRQVTLVSGYFDPLLAAHALRLSEVARPGQALFVAVEDPPCPVLATRARAELVAGLSVVDYVVLAGQPAAGLEGIEADRVFAERDADRRRTQELMQHVHDRQRETR